ncbi:glycosyltransferase family 4 protein [Polymorphobacter fuscus]|uniref:Undecaprenyl/decaprenyl-phosphate alpha-N-acetylglucosaminyl 1-phosphate transferase n=1 Tax=Sandarakinorhabdus fusca TaxID=1439888 RepID=A0A7C9GM65_9SPHN|nr:MraY family glycosyltransferase [Polymorphobacter fuscus]KAB7648245.1 undecaprenyl/decaprenyl-phosphate alpha-N-acetylglucosaminyl 1-phosphate transferase [Polymorphobacter fuscus]MQT15752.1 hypothetical protein [Polymorphobacter fuscus]NJC07977.1 UDP-GlcNAc:undecaprenyl-phosphate GlcNAc-1-phosphate transferase [Polymorphobacter fuscus]
MSTLLLFAIAAFLGLGIATLVGANAMRIGRALRLLDHPDGGRKIHARATPLVGGIAVAAAAVVGSLLALAHYGDPQLAWLAAAVAAMFAIGVADDRVHLPPVIRLVLALLALGVVVASATDFQVLALRFADADRMVLGGYVGLAFTLLCLVGLLNAVNMADGKDGIVVGCGLVWTAVLTVHAAHGALLLLPVLLATGAALLVLLVFNLRRRLFLGDGGSYALSALFGLLAIYVYNDEGTAMRADDVALLFAIPVFDTIRLMAVRIAGGRSPFHADRDHFHHHLYARIGWPRGLVIYLGLVALPNLAALLWPGTAFGWLVVSFIAYAVVMALTRFVPAGRPAE